MGKGFSKKEIDGLGVRSTKPRKTNIKFKLYLALAFIVLVILVAGYVVSTGEPSTVEVPASIKGYLLVFFGVSAVALVVEEIRKDK